MKIPKHKKEARKAFAFKPKRRCMGCNKEGENHFVPGSFDPGLNIWWEGYYSCAITDVARFVSFP